jgi:hypothetical protein
VCVVAGTAGTASGQEEPAEAAACPVVASAQAMSTTVQKDGDLTFAKPVGPEVPAAQICLDVALSVSTAFAAAAYPGATVAAAPGAAAEFPGYVSSSHPGTPEAKSDSGAAVVQARSSRTVSEAKAVTGPPSVGTRAGAASAEAKGTVNTTAGTARATAAAVTTPIAIDGVLALGEVRSSAEALLRPDGTIERASILEVGRSTVAGQVVTITPAGVQAAGQAVPLPSSPEVSEVLAQAGVTVTYLAAEPTANGILSPGLSIQVVAKDSAGVRTVTRHVVGRAFAAAAAVDAGAEGPASGPAEAPTTASTTGTTSASAFTQHGDSGGTAGARTLDADVTGPSGLAESGPRKPRARRSPPRGRVCSPALGSTPPSTPSISSSWREAWCCSSAARRCACWE